MAWPLLTLTAKHSTRGRHCGHNRSSRDRLHWQLLMPFSSGRALVLHVGANCRSLGPHGEKQQQPESPCWAPTAWDNLPEQSEGDRTLFFSYPIQASAVELPPLEIKECPVTQASVPAGLLFLMHTLKDRFHQDYFCSHKDQRMSQSDTERLMLSP